MLGGFGEEIVVVLEFFNMRTTNGSNSFIQGVARTLIMVHVLLSHNLKSHKHDGTTR